MYDKLSILKVFLDITFHFPLTTIDTARLDRISRVDNADMDSLRLITSRMKITRIVDFLRSKEHHSIIPKIVHHNNLKFIQSSRWRYAYSKKRHPFIQIDSGSNQVAQNQLNTNLFNSSVECPNSLKNYETADHSNVDDPDVSPVLLPFTNRRITKTASKVHYNHFWPFFDNCNGISLIADMMPLF